MYKAEFTEHPVPAGAEWKVLGERVCMYESSVHLQRYGIVDDAEDGKCHVIYDNEEESWVQLPREGFTVVRPFDGPLIEEAQRTNSDQREEGDEEDEAMMEEGYEGDEAHGSSSRVETSKSSATVRSRISSR